MPFGDGCQQTAAEKRRLVTATCMQKKPFDDGLQAASGSCKKRSGYGQTTCRDSRLLTAIEPALKRQQFAGHF
jgi:hypothetical protein